MEPIENATAGTGPVATANAAGRSDQPERRNFFTPERICLAILLAIFAAFTWRRLLSFYSGDDMMNTYWAWTWNHKAMGWANLLVWMPIYRPLGEIIYLAFYAAFGFHPAPLYIFCWLLLVGNVFAVYVMFRALFSAASAALTALALIVVHGAYIELYSSAGTIFDHLWFLFTAVGVTVYVRMRQKGPGISLGRIAILWALCVLAMDSKESGVALPVLLVCYECVFILPEEWRGKTVRRWLRSVGPLYTILAGTCIAFVYGRVFRTPVLVAAAGYHPKASATVWLQNVAYYFDMLAYRKGLFTAAGVAGVLIVMTVAAILLRNRIMIFGLLCFIVTITPVALLTLRPGYVLYVPVVGFGLYFGEILAAAVRELSGRFSGRAAAVAYSTFAFAAIATTWWHAANWPGFPRKESDLLFLLVNQFHREHPTMKRSAKLLFTSDYFPHDVWDIQTALQLLYHDKLLEVRRLDAMPDQQPSKDQPPKFDYVFAAANWRYEELDGRDVQESIRLHILRNYSVGRETALDRWDRRAYFVSGIKDVDGPDLGRWTDPKATLKFDVYPVASTLALHYWVPDVVAASPAKTLTIRVNGDVVGTVSLTKDGDHTESFPVKAAQISRSGFTIVDLVVDKPYKGADGTEFGVILLSAGFEYAR